MNMNEQNFRGARSAPPVASVPKYFWLRHWLDCNGTVFKVWSVDGNNDYFSGKHLILVIFSSCVLGVGVAYPLLVLFAPLLEQYSGKCIPYKWNFVLKLKPLLDAYGGPYRDGHRYWTGVTLLVRLVVTILFSFTSGRLVFLNSIIIATTVQTFFFVWLFTRGVYRNLILCFSLTCLF